MKRQILTAIALILSISFIFALSSCTNEEIMPDEGISNEENTSIDEFADEFQAFTLDNYGSQVVITAKPERVLTLGPNCTELFIALGLTDYIIGHSLADHSRGPLPEFADDYARIPELTYSHATREAVITSGADFIYGIDWEFGGEINTDELSQYGITVYMNAAKTLEEQFQEISDIGRIFQIEERAQNFIADQKARIQAVQEKIADSQIVKVLLYDHGSSGVFTAGGSNFASLLIGLAGGENIFDDITDSQWATVSFEEVLAREPDVIIINDYDVPPVNEKINEIRSGILAQLESVKNEHFVIIELESILPGNRMAFTVEKLASGFFPEHFS
jgi:iron complex transport system substrate-binding protein